MSGKIETLEHLVINCIIKFKSNESDSVIR